MLKTKLQLHSAMSYSEDELTCSRTKKLTKRTPDFQHLSNKLQLLYYQIFC